MIIRIWKKNGETTTTTVTAEQMDQIKALADRFGWEIDLIGKRPW